MMNMVGMNPAAAGGMMMMNNGSPATPSNSNGAGVDPKVTLNTAIYEYFLKLGLYEVARSLVHDPKFDLKTTGNIKQSPGRRKDAEMNGDTDGMDMDMNDKIPDDLPRPGLLPSSTDSQGNGFLLDWFSLFLELFSAQRKTGLGEVTAARQYLNQTQSIQRLRETQQNQNVPRQGGMPGGPANFTALRNMRNGIMTKEMQQQAMAAKMTPQQLQVMSQQNAIRQQQQAMQREHSDVEMNGRPETPADGENGGSPSKRQRTDNPQFNGNMGPNGRGPGMPVMQPQMLMQSGFNPNMAQGQFRHNPAAMQQKVMQGQMGNPMMNMGNSGSPMLGPMSDPQFANGGMPVDIYNSRMAGQAMQGGPGGQGGNHALQDYQMQLMLLEQQNKKRLMMARQEQDNITSRTDGGPQMPGQVGMQPPGMSPSGSRSGTSPNPSDQIKRGTPQLGGLPGSPAPGDGLQGRSPGMNFMNGSLPDFNTQMFMKQADGLNGPGGPGMQPPNPMNIGAPMAQNRRMPNQFSGGQPMAQQPSQGQPQPMGTPGQRNNEMPPPSAPAAGNVAGQRAPPSPQQNQAPPTPSQTNKANPKKKGNKEGDKKKPAKKGSVAPSSDADPPATPTPSTPITPQHASSFNPSMGKGGVPGAPPNNAGPTSNPAQVPQQQIQPDLQNPNYFGDNTDPTFNLDFSTLDGDNVLENFDFDSFLNTNDGNGDFNFDQSIGVEGFGLADGSVE